MKTFLIVLALLACSTMTLAALDTTAVLTVRIHGNGTSSHGDTTKLTSTPLVTSNTVVPDAGYYIDSVLVNGTNKGRKWTVAVTLADSTDQTLDMYFSANPYGAAGFPGYGVMRVATLVGLSDPKFAKIHTGDMLVYDTTRYILTMPYDLGGRPLIYGIKQIAMADTVDLNLVLEGSTDNSTWRGVDSLTITTPETVGEYIKNVDLTLVRYPYWRLRFGNTTGATAALAGNIALAGRFNMFAITNLNERF